MTGGKSVGLPILMCLVVLAGALGLVFVDPHRPAQGVTVIERAQDVLFATEGGRELWRASDVALPQNWNTDTPLAVRAEREVVEAEYRIRFEAAETERAHAIMIARVSQSVRIRINGVKIHTDHDEGALDRWDWYSPVVADIPAGLLRDGKNDLSLTVAAAPGSFAGLSRIYFGEEAAIASMEDRLLFLQKSLPVYANLSVMVMAVPLLLIWLHGRKVEEGPFRIYGLLAAAAFIFAVRSLHVQVVEPPMPHHLWLLLVRASLGWALGFFMAFVLHFVGAASKWSDRALLIFIGVLTLVLIVIPGERMTELGPLFSYLPLAAIGSLCVAIVCLRTIRSPDAGRVGLSLSILLLLAAGIHDVLWSRGLLAFESLLFMPVVMPLVLLAMSAAVANRFVREWVAADALNRNLTARVREAEAEVAASYERRLVAERRETLASERAKLVQDLHDGVGSRLSVLMATLQTSQVPPERIVEMLRECLDDLKMVITARDQTVLGDALSETTSQFGRLLETRGIEMDLEIEREVAALRVGPTEMLNLLRFVQEACANAVRYGKGNWIRLEGRFVSPGTVRIAVSDGGEGRSSQNPVPVSSGRGIGTMKARAARLDAKFAIRTDADGWHISLDVPAGRLSRAAGADKAARASRSSAMRGEGAEAAAR